MKNLKITLGITFLFCFSLFISAQARLTIENNSMRNMTVKVMKGAGKGELYEMVSIMPWSSQTVYFSESGTYFTKSKAVIQGKNPVFRKGNPFRVTNDSTGYSVMTLTFSIKESSVPVATGGRQISKAEFDQN